ncbi:hypothetical protein [Flavisphingomonas formosensis]|uniref:hypothetical protein n=1 Tax=Flavisphingomonas formosensis TaxID=861534 RepID=UPI0012FB1ACF|nr:hypothetical protein [Sphingomonas formosensis]
MSPIAHIRRMVPADELPLLLSAFALNGISYLPMMTMPWFVSGLSSEFALNATQAGIVGTLLLGAIALTTGAAALKLTAGHARATGAMGGALALAALCLLLLFPGLHSLPLLLLGGVGFGLAAASANALLAASADPVRLNGGIWFLTVIWQVLVWAVTPFLAGRAPLAGVVGVEAIGAGLLLLVVLAARPRPVGSVQSGRDEGRQARRPAALGAALLIGVIAFWLRDGITWSLVDRRASLLGIEPGKLALTLTSTSLIALAGPALTLVLGERFGRFRTIAAVQAAACVILFTIAAAERPAVYCGALLLWSCISILAWTYLVGLAAVVDRTGRVAAACGSLLFGASALAPTLGGLLFDRWQSGLPPVILSLGIVTLATACYVAARLPQEPNAGPSLVEPA